MKFSLVTLLLFFSGSFYAQYLTTDWGTLFKTKSYPFAISHRGKVVSVTSDPDGNVYVASVFRDTLVLQGVSNSVTLVSSGNNDGVIAKFNSSGACLWAHKIGGTGQDFCNIISLISDSSVVIGGGYSGQVDFDPSANDSICTSNNPYDLFLLKLNSEGEFQWVRTLNGSSSMYDCIHGLKENSNHELVLTGEFSGTLDLDPGVNSYTVTGEGSVFFQFNDIFLASYDSNGGLIWGNRIGGTGSFDVAFDLDLDGDDNMVISGYFRSKSIDMDPSAGSSIIHNTDTLNPLTDVFLAKYDVNGNHMWSGGLGGPSSEYGNTVDVSPNGDVVICGSFYGNVDFDITAGTHFVNSNGDFLNYMAKYSTSGELVWVKFVKNLFIEEASISDQGTFFLVGTFMDTLNFDGQTLIANGTNDCFVAELSSNGNLMWMNSFGGPNGDVLHDVHLISENEIVVGGAFKSLIDIDSSPANYEFIGESTLSNFFIAKYSLGDLGLDELNAIQSTIYPNPNSGEYLQVTSSQPFVLIELFDLYGKKILESDSSQVDVSFVENGEYFVRIHYSNQTAVTHKFIICK